jgi:hypothetical protein
MCDPVDGLPGLEAWEQAGVFDSGFCSVTFGEMIIILLCVVLRVEPARHVFCH